MKLVDNTAFSDALVAYSKFWKKKNNLNSDSVIVDVMHDNMEYVTYNLTAAKYISELNGDLKIHALAKNWETPFNDYQFEINSYLSEAFYCDSITSLDSVLTDNICDSDKRTISKLEEFLSEEKSFNIRNYIFSNEEHDRETHALLRIAYDHFIRDKLLATKTEICREFIDSVITCASYRSISKNIVESMSVKYAVLGHVEYSPYYFIAEQVINAGGTVFFHWPLVFGSVRIIDSIDGLNRVKNERFVESYKNEYEGNIAAFEDSVREYSEGLIARLTASRNYADFDGYSSSLTKAEFLESAGVTEPRNRTIVLLSHALSDAVHANGPMLFEDFGHWLESTLDCFVGDEDVNILVKVHPKDITYETSGFIAYISEKYKDYANFGVLSKYVNNRIVAEHADVISTVQGTPGYEMLIAGVATEIAGEARYSGIDVVDNYATQKEYFDSLKISALSGNLDDKKVKNSIHYAFFENVYTKVLTNYSAPLAQFSDNNIAWKNLCERLKSTLKHQDPLYRSLKEINFSELKKFSYLVNPEFKV